MRTLSILAATVLLACTAGCGERNAPEPPTTATGASAPPARATEPAVANTDQGVTHRFECQAGTTVAMLDDGDARVSLPGGERHLLSPVTGSEPQVYTGDSLYFTIAPGSAGAGARTAHLSQQDGMRELACTKAN